MRAVAAVRPLTVITSSARIMAADDSGKRDRDEEDAAPAVGPAPPAPGDAGDDEPVDVGPAMPPKAKKKKTLAFEQVYLDSMPSASMYEKSYMHRDDVTCVAVTPGTDFFITGQRGWPLEVLEEEVRGDRVCETLPVARGTVVGLSVSADGLYCATIGHDNSAKIYDVVNFDMTLMLRLPFTPTACEFVYKKGRGAAKNRRRGCDGEDSRLRRGVRTTEPVKVLETHRAAVRRHEVQRREEGRDLGGRQGGHRVLVAVHVRVPAGRGFVPVQAGHRLCTRWRRRRPRR